MSVSVSVYIFIQDAAMIFSVMTKYYPAPGALREYCNNTAAYADAVSKQVFLPEPLGAALAKTGRTPAAGDVKYMFYTRSGPGPVEQPQSEALLSPQTGLPVPAGPKHKQMKVSHAVTPVPLPVPVASTVAPASSSTACCPLSPSNLMFAALFIGAGIVIGGKLKK
jgi:hypothetical protein